MAQLVFGTGDSIGFGTTGNGTSVTASFNKTDIANMRVGDLLVAWIHNQSSVVSGSITPPTGWTRFGAALGTSTWANSRTSGIYYYPLASQAAIDALDETPTWTFGVAGSRVGCVAARATGVNLNNIEDSASTAFQGGSGLSLTITGITTVSATTLLVGALHHQNSASTTAPSTTSFLTGFQEYKTSPTGSALANTGAALAYSNLTSAGATGNVVPTFDTAATASGGELVAFKAGAWTAPSITRPTIMGVPTTFATSSAVTSFSINKPSWVIDGDALIMALSAQSATTTVDFASNGWTRISKDFVASSGGVRTIAFYARPVPSAAALSDTSFTFTSTDSGPSGRIAAEMFVVRGAELSDLTAATSPYGFPSGQSVTVKPDTPEVGNGLLLVAYNAQFVSSEAYTVASGPSGMTLQKFLPSSTGAQSKTILAVYKQNVETTYAGDKTLTWTGAQAQTSGCAITIRAAGALDPNNGRPVKYTSALNTLADGHMLYTSALNTLSTPLEVRPMPTGYATVAAMLASTPFYIAHRGGSASWPEMSLYAYTQSVFWGLGALEISLGRSSDGVWFGLHDDTLDRTSGTTGFTASAHTWAEIQAFQITAAETTNPAQPTRPYMRWEELMDVYYDSHVIMVDPKFAVGFRSEMLDMMDAMPGTPTDKFLVKYYGVSSALATDARARGYKTWGYFYQADAANFAAYQGYWDILGLEFSADQATWNTMLAYGKPVIAHTIQDGTAAGLALGHGASGMMVANITEVVPRTP
jgi:hypothetical protein